MLHCRCGNLDAAGYRPVNFAAMSITRVGILGSGIMGSGIAEVAAAKGHEVVLRSRSQAAADAMVAGLGKSLAKQVEKGKRTEAEAAEISGRVRATTHLGELVEVDLVIESVVEDLAIKKELFRELDSVCKPDTILATNTSTLPVIEMAMATSRPDHVCGVHFFNPAPAMSLVEVTWRRWLTRKDARSPRRPSYHMTRWSWRSVASPMISALRARSASRYRWRTPNKRSASTAV